jgi:tetratricopeptide (TPR) repeat protein/tRNA A-37 threonylcarbamoyl transferase component Bud32
MPSERWQYLEGVLDRFEEAWKRGERPALDDYLADIDGERRALLIELAHEDLDYRLKAGEIARVESYLERYPELGSDPAVLLDLLAAEYLLRQGRGEAVSLEEYRQRFPGQAEGLAAEVARRRDQGSAPAEASADGESRHEVPTVPPPVPPPQACPTVPATTPDSRAARRPGQLPTGAPATVAPPDLPLPAAELLAVAGYEILGPLGRGGMGVVYRARQIGLDRIVALKMIRQAEYAEAEERERFVREAQAAARLQHPNIVQVFEVSELRGQPYFSLEFCAGGSLADRLDGTPWQAQPAAALVETLARAMAYAHQQGIIHRDLKPPNVLLTPDGVPKITDFGLAKRLDQESQTREGVIMGTPSYMAPEQAGGKSKDIGPRADVYALGAILYELLTGRPPFKASSDLDTILQVISEEPVAVRRLQPKVPRDLETVCHKCLEKDAGRRYASAHALAEDLRLFRAGEPVAARPAGPVRRGVKWCRRRPAAAALLGVGVLAVVAAAVGIPLNFAHLRAVAQEAREEADEANARATRETNAARARTEAAHSLQQGQEALQRKGPGDLEQARVLFTQVRDSIHDAQTDPELTEYRTTAQRLLDELNKREQARKNFQAVALLRDEALFHLYRDVFTGEDSSGAAQAQKAARQALQPYGLPDAALREDTLVGLEPDEVPKLRSGLYEVCLVLAEALVRPQPGQAPEERRRLAAEALRVVDRAAALAPDALAPRRRRARYLALAGDQAAAAREQAAAANAALTTATDWLFTGCDLAFDKGDWAGAVRHFDGAIGQDRRLFWAHFFRAVACQKLTQNDKAIASLTACATERPDFIWTYLLRGTLYAQTRAFQAATDDFALAERLRPDDNERFVLYVNRGYASLRAGQPRKAVEDLEKAAALKPKLYYPHLNLAEAYLQLKDPAAAIGHLDTAIALQPNQASLYRMRARAHRLQGDRRAALHDVDEAMKRWAAEGRPRQALDHRDRAQDLYLLGRYPQALQACVESLALNPNDAIAHRLHGEVLFKLDCFEEALAAFDEHLKRAAEKPAVEFFLQRARVREKLHDTPGLIEEYTSALRLTPRDAHLHVLRGWAYLVNDFSTALALRDFEEAIRLEPKQAEAYLGRGAAYARRGQYREAAWDAEEALRRDPESRRMSYNAARVFAQALDRLEELADPGSPRTAEARTRYQDRAVTCLRRALSQLPQKEQRPFWNDQVLRDPAFTSLKGTVGFRRLAADVSGSTR